MPAAEPEAEPGGQPVAAEHEVLAEIANPADLADLLGSSSFWKLQQAPQSPFEELQGYRAQHGAAVGEPDKSQKTTPFVAPPAHASCRLPLLGSVLPEQCKAVLILPSSYDAFGHCMCSDIRPMCRV